MNYADEQRSPMRHIVGITIVVVFHVLLIYALINGLGSNLVALIKPPIETKIIKDTKPPPPEAPPPPPPQLAAPPPPFVPPPDFVVANPPPSTTAITEVTHTAPPATPMVATAPPAVKSAVPDSEVSARPIAGAPLEYPAELQEADDLRDGRVTISCDVDVNGSTSNCSIGSVTGGASFAREAMKYVTHARYRPAIRNGVAIPEHHSWNLIFKAPE